MAEQEVIKHTKKIYKTWFSKEHSFWHKLGEFGVEILIIVFAVTISIWFHNWSEHTHQQAEVKEFLEGLKLDLLSDIQEMKSDQSSYEGQKRIFNYLAALKIGSPVSLDSMRKHQASLFNNTALNPNDGRFQGFKSSGKIGLIENHDIQNDIMDLYEEDIPALLSSTNTYTGYKNKFYEFIFKNKKRYTDSTSNFIELLKTDEGNNWCAALSNPAQVLERYQKCIDLMNRIVGEINRQYP
jgi:hypothetical protein